MAGTWHNKLVDFLTRQDAHEDELDAISSTKGDEPLSRFGFHLVSGLITQDNKSEWTNSDVMCYISNIFFSRNVRGAGLAVMRIWPSIAIHFSAVAEGSKSYYLGSCDASFIPQMAKFIKAKPSQILKSFHYRRDVDSLDRGFVTDTLVKSIVEWHGLVNAETQTELIENIYYHGTRWMTPYDVISCLEQGAYLLDSKTKPGLVLAQFAKSLFREFNLGDGSGDEWSGLRCLDMTGVDYRDLCSGYTWTNEDAGIVEANNRILTSRRVIAEVLPIRPIVDMTIDYLFAINPQIHSIL